MVVDICMVDIIEVDIITIMDVDIDLGTIIIGDIDIIMDVVTELNPDVMGIIKINMIIETVVSIENMVDIINTIERRKEKIKRRSILDHTTIDRYVYLSSMMRDTLFITPQYSLKLFQPLIHQRFQQYNLTLP